MIRWLFRVPFWIGIIGLIFLYQGYVHRARAEEDAVPLRCGSPELAQANHVRLGWCVVESALAQRGRYSPEEQYWLVLREPDATQVSALVTIGTGMTEEQAALTIQGIERELAAGELELFRANGEGEHALLRARPDLASAPFVGTRSTPAVRLESGNGGMWLGGVLLLVDVIRSCLILIWALRSYMA